MQSLAREFDDVHFALVHVDTGGEVLARFDASSVPAYILFRDGQEIDRLIILPGWEEARLRRMLTSARGS